MTSVQLTGRHRLVGDGVSTRGRLAVAAVMVSAGFAGWLAAELSEEAARPAAAVVSAPPAAAPAVAPVSAELPAAADSGTTAHQFQRSGQIVAVSHDSLTTVTGNETTTFRITPQTARITMPGATAPASFAPHQHVLVLGVMHDGVPVATAIADERAVGPDGPPLDYQLPT